MQQISLGQTEYYSDNGMYYRNSTGTSCNPTSTTSTNIETNLLGGSDNITNEIGYELCISNDPSEYKITAKETGGNCKIDESVMIGTGAIINQNVNIGSNSIIGTGTVVLENVKKNYSIVDFPRKIKKKK